MATLREAIEQAGGVGGLLFSAPLHSRYAVTAGAGVNGVIYIPYNPDTSCKPYDKVTNGLAFVLLVAFLVFAVKQYKGW